MRLNIYIFRTHFDIPFRSNWSVMIGRLLQKEIVTTDVIPANLNLNAKKQIWNSSRGSRTKRIFLEIEIGETEGKNCAGIEQRPGRKKPVSAQPCRSSYG